MNLLRCCDEQQISLNETIKIIKILPERETYHKSSKIIKELTKTIVLTINKNKLTSIDFIKSAKQQNPQEDTIENTKSSIHDFLLLSHQFETGNEFKNHYKPQRLQQFTCAIMLDANLKVISAKQIKSKITNSSFQSPHRSVSTMTNNNNIITPWAEPMISLAEGTTNFMTIPTASTSTTTTTTSTSTWSNVYEKTLSSSNNFNINPFNSNNSSYLINPFNSTTATYKKNSLNNEYNIQDDNDSEMLRTIEYIGTLLNFYYVPIIVGTGSIGNILSVCVFFRTKLRKLSSSFYLAALAVSDTCFLLGLFAQWLNFVDINIYNREYFCQFFTFFSNLSCFCSVWFVVGFTVERFIAVMYPLKRQTMCTVRRAKTVLTGLTILGCLHCTPFLIYSTPVYSPKLETTICDIKSEYKDSVTLLNYWDTIVVFAVPFTAIAILNTFTGYTVWKFATVRRTLTMQKMKTQHLPLHGVISSPSSSCSVREGLAVNNATTAAASGNTVAGEAKTLTQQQQQGISTYRISTSSLKGQKSTSSTSLTHTSEQHNHNVFNHNHHNHNNHNHHSHSHHHQQQQQHHYHHHQHQHHLLQTESSEHMDAHPNRANVIKKPTSGNNDYDDMLARKSRRRKIPNSSQLKVTKMLLIVSTVFVCLNLPSFIMRMITYLETQSSANEKTTVVLQYIFQLLFVTNFGINFVLYCVSGQNFRKAVLSMFRKVSTTQRDGTTQITVSEYCRNSGGIGAACGTNISTRRRLKTQNCWNEIHELQHLK